MEQVNIPDIHVGNMVLGYLKKNRITQAELARGLELDTSYLHRLLSRKSIETDKLLKICIALDYNFFPVFCNDSSAYVEGTAFGPVNLGVHIEKRLKEIGMTQVEFASKLGVAQSEVSRLLKKESFETDKLTIISRILSYNFFRDFYHGLPAEESKDTYARILLRYEEIIIENDRLRNEVEKLKKENAELKKMQNG